MAQKRTGPTRRAFTALAGAGLLAGAARAQDSPGRDVDLLLALAVDASGSVSPRRFELQKQGYVTAFRNPQVLRAIRSGMLGAIAVAMYQWTGPRLQREVLPWTRVDDEASANALADAIDAAPRRLFGGGTSISGAIDHGATLFPAAPFRATRRVIDVSGDGTSSSGRPVSRARDEAVAAGIVVNGLPILAVEFELDVHFQEEVIGGPGSFMIAAKDFESFGDAIRRKLVAEIAGRPPRFG